jgi:hypothetical protein
MIPDGEVGCKICEKSIYRIFVEHIENHLPPKVLPPKDWSTISLLNAIRSNKSIVLSPEMEVIAKEVEKRGLCACHTCNIKEPEHKSHRHAHDASGKMVSDER